MTPIISTSIQREWISRVSPIFRYMNATYIREFFESGNLRISSFRVFRKHPGEALRDTTEGHVMLTTAFGDKEFASFQVYDDSAYVLCGSRECSRALQEKFKSTGIMKIRDPLPFAAIVGSHIPGFQRGMDGECEYFEHPFVTRLGDAEFERIARGAFKDPKGVPLEAVLELASRQFGPDVYFRKTLAYKDDREVRMLWFANRCKEYIDICVPEAREFCEQIVLD